jgi:hypothetical protein
VQDAELRVAEDVDEPGAHRLARRVDDSGRLRHRVRLDDRHPVTEDADVGAQRFSSGAVIHVAARDQDIEHRAPPSRRARSLLTISERRGHP